MRRLVPFAACAALAAALTQSAPAPAGATGPCTVSGSTFTVAAPTDTRAVVLDSVDGLLVVHADDEPLCSVPEVGIGGVDLLDSDNNSVDFWRIVADSPYAGPVRVENDRSDLITVVGSAGVDQWTNVGGGVIDLDADPTTDNRLETAAVPLDTYFNLEQGGEDVLNLRGPEPWTGDVQVLARAVTSAKTLRLGDGDDAVHLGAGADTVLGFGGDDEILGGGGSDVIVGGPGADDLRGEGGRDTFLDPVVGDRPDQVDGGSGIDTVDHSGRRRGVWAKEGSHRGVGRVPAYADRIDRVEQLVGTPRADRLFGAAGSQVLLGMDGDDRLAGLAGKDTLRGGDGNDELRDRDRYKDLLDGGRGRDGAERNASDVVRMIEFRLR